jgi:hypothetical protein
MRAHVKKLVVVKRFFFRWWADKKNGGRLRSIPDVWSTFKPVKYRLTRRLVSGGGLHSFSFEIIKMVLSWIVVSLSTIDIVLDPLRCRNSDHLRFAFRIGVC